MLKEGTASVVIFYSFIEALLAKLSNIFFDNGRILHSWACCSFRQENAVGKVYSSSFFGTGTSFNMKVRNYRDSVFGSVKK